MRKTEQRHTLTAYCTYGASTRNVKEMSTYNSYNL
jgi:hypothetical protein